MGKFVALYMGAPGGGTRADLTEEDIARGMAAWGGWMQANAARIVDAGGPLGKTKKTSAEGVADTRNHVTGYVVVEADSHEAAARLFEGHPHFSIFPGDSVEIMELMPIPTA
ncbi:hypothetical protein [Phenylobacterium sp.]|uniref:hypothetical protein n=1 Tax=Phenylobacterium sp. TaxID=1871053 RepID=UPI0035B0280E